MSVARIEFTIGEIARRLEAPLEGDAARVVRTISPLEDAGPEALSWLGSDKYASLLETTRAAAILAPLGTAIPRSIPCIRVADPDMALSRILPWFAPPPPEVTPGVHPTAIIETGAIVDGASIGPHAFIGAAARIGSGTQIHAGVYVGDSATIGAKCILWPNVVVRERCLIGDRVVIHSNSTIGADGFGYLFRKGEHRKVPQVGIVVIEDDVEIGANSCVDRARSGETRIGRGTKIDNLVQIAHNCQVGEHCIVVAQVGMSGSSNLGRYVTLAGQSGVSDHVTVGDGARVGAQSGVKDDVPAGATMFGTPAQLLVEVGRQDAAVKKLPKLLEQVRKLSKRIDRLESSANDKG
jgi:UDP-3-O-[3-hydroxymyristoyl] glucosamine N-acyltransferase